MQIPSNVSQIKSFNIGADRENQGEKLAEIPNPFYGKPEIDRLAVLAQLAAKGFVEGYNRRRR